MKDFRKDPLGWVRAQFPDIWSHSQADKILSSLEQRAPFRPEHLVEVMRDRTELPEVIMMRGPHGDMGVPRRAHGMLHFPAEPRRSGRRPDTAFSTTGDLRPKVLVLPNGTNLWGHGSGSNGFFISTVGVDTSLGGLYHCDGCAPRAVLNSLRVPVDYHDYAALLGEYDHLGMSIPHARNVGVPIQEASAILEDHYGETGLVSAQRYYTADNSRLQEEVQEAPQRYEEIKHAYDLVRNAEGVLQVVGRQHNGDPVGHTHAIGFLNGKHVRSSVYEKFTPENTWAVIEAFTPVEP